MPRRRILKKTQLGNIDKKILICGVVKNVEDKIKFNINQCLETGNRFKDFKIVIYENNSTDNTKNILNQYKDDNRFKIISEDLDNIKEKSLFWAYTEVTGSDHSCKIEQISNARNKVIEEIKKEEYEDFDFVMWVDLDSRGWQFKSLDFLNHNDWHAMYAISNPYYDWYALRKEGDLDPSFLGETWWQNTYNSRFKNLTPVWSAFNGIGIFRKEVFKNNKYDFKVNQDIKDLFRKTINNENYNKFKDVIEKDCPKFKGGQKDEESSIYWKNNSGYKGMVVCEHICLNAALINKGYKLFINPDIIYIDGGR